MQRTSLSLSHSLAAICSVCLIRVWRDESKQRGFFRWESKRDTVVLSPGNAQDVLSDQFNLSPDHFFPPDVTSTQKPASA